MFIQNFLSCDLNIIQPNKHDTIQILKSLNVNNTKGKAPSRSNSSTKQNEEESLKLRIKQLKQEAQYLKNNSSNKENSNNEAALNIPTQH